MERHDSPGSTPRLLQRLIQQAGWTEGLSDERRRKILEDCHRDLERDDIKPRDKNRLLDIILKMEAADVSRARLQLDAQKMGSHDVVNAEDILKDLDEAKKRRGQA